MCSLAEVEQIQSIGSISPLKKTPSCDEGPKHYLMLDFSVYTILYRCMELNSTIIQISYTYTIGSRESAELSLFFTSPKWKQKVAGDTLKANLTHP